MAATVTAFRADHRDFTTWFRDFLRSELTPYPGRGLTVARMVIAATITMILIMTWRIPGAAIGPLYAILISRENLVSTVRSALSVVGAFALGGLFIPIGATMFASIPLTHFVWQGVSLFLIFFLIRTLKEFGLATGVGLMGASIVALWYLPGPAELNIERTLWLVAAPALGAGVTLLVEVVFHAFDKQDEMVMSLDARLEAVEGLLKSYVAGTEVPRQARSRLTQYVMVGAGRLRRRVARSNVEQQYRAEMTAVIALVARTVDFAAAMMNTYPELSKPDREIARNVAAQIVEIRSALAEKRRPKNLDFGMAQSTIPLLREMEAMAGLIPRAFEGSLSLEAFQAPLPDDERRSALGFLVPDAFVNPEYLHFAMSGCLAGMLCYTLYVALAWPGLSSSVTTCVLTALSTMGASRQKQTLRLAGAVLGGFVLGIGAQIFVLPNIDTITGFSLLFAAATAVAAWTATASSRLSYCGLQIALAFYLVNVNDFTIQTSLTIARDRVLGVLLGSWMMWLVFERLHSKPAAVEMMGTFTANLRLLGGLANAAERELDPKTVAAIRKLRDTIYANFAAVNAQADAVPFELGEARARHMAARDRVRRWQAMLQTFYLLQLALLQARAFRTANVITESEHEMLDTTNRSCAQALFGMAKYLEAQRDEKLPPQPPTIERPVQLEWLDDKPGSLLSLAQELGKIVERMREEMLAVPLYQE